MATREMIEIAFSGDDHPPPEKGGAAVSGPGERQDKRQVTTEKRQGMSDRPAYSNHKSRSSEQKVFQSKTVEQRPSPFHPVFRGQELSHHNVLHDPFAVNAMRGAQSRDASLADTKLVQEAKKGSSKSLANGTPVKDSSDTASLRVGSKTHEVSMERSSRTEQFSDRTSINERNGEPDAGKISNFKRSRGEEIVPSATVKKRRVEIQQSKRKSADDEASRDSSEFRPSKVQRMSTSYFDKEVVDLTGPKNTAKPIVIEDDSDAHVGTGGGLKPRVSIGNPDHHSASKATNANRCATPVSNLASSRKTQHDIGPAPRANAVKVESPHSFQNPFQKGQSQTYTASHRALKQVTHLKQNQAFDSLEALTLSRSTAEHAKRIEDSDFPAKTVPKPKDAKTIQAKIHHPHPATRDSPIGSRMRTLVREVSPPIETHSLKSSSSVLSVTRPDPTSTASGMAGRNESRRFMSIPQSLSGVNALRFTDLEVQQTPPPLRGQMVSLPGGDKPALWKEPVPTDVLVQPADLPENISMNQCNDSPMEEEVVAHQLQHATQHHNTEVVAGVPLGSLMKTGAVKSVFDDNLVDESPAEALPQDRAFEKAGVHYYGRAQWRHVARKLGDLVEQKGKYKKQAAFPAKPDVTAGKPQVSETPSPVQQERSQRPLSRDHTTQSHGGGIAAEINGQHSGISANSNYTKAAMPGLGNTASSTGLRALNHVERVLGRHLEELSNDSEYWTRALLRRARCSKKAPVVPTGMAPFSFSSLKAVHTSTPAGSRQGSRAVGFAIDCPATKKKLHFTTPVTTYMVMDAMPAFSHYVDIKRNFLALNQRTMISWPYFGDDYNEINRKKGQDPEKEIGEVYSLDIDDRPKKLLHLIQAQRYDTYIEAALNDLDISWTDLLRFLLELSPDVGAGIEARKALDERDKYCVGDFSRKASRVAIVLSSIPESVSKNLATAALLFENFQKMTGTSLWHVARRHMYDKISSDSLERGTRDGLDKFTCRVCLRFQCPYHGEVQEVDDIDDTATDDALADAAIKDIVNPKFINSRERVEFRPMGTEARTPKRLEGFPMNIRQNAQSLVQRNPLRELNELGPFYPCHHPGKSCEDSHCTCFESGILCEKTCSCSSDCSRRFRGCSCSSERRRKGQKTVCFEDERCACLKMSRECDPDLCGACGVADVLDPHRRHDPEVLVGRCHNASVQRGVTKHTLVGRSLIAGLGLFTTEPIEQHEFVGEYKGEIISHDEAERRWTVYQHQGLHYIFSLNAAQEVDGTYYGNKTRFVNHARPGKFNLYPKTRLVNSVHRIALYAARKIRPGEELFFDYGPMFPDELVGGKTDKKNLAPRAENLKDYYDVEQAEDEHGTLHTRKVTVGGTKTKFKSNARAGGAKSVRIGDTVREPAVANGLLEDVAEQERGGGGAATKHASSAETGDAKHRLYSFNVSDDDDHDMLLDIPEPEEDDDFEPEADASDDDEDDDDATDAKRRYDDDRPREAERPRRI
nr:histone-lysine n-methyltransferase e(z) [Quercus suber]